MIGILGGGFGLYGYIPAISHVTNDKVLLPSKYLSKFQSRQELLKYQKNILWVESEDDVINLSTTLIVAKRPSDQFLLLPKVFSKSQLTHIIFEKPLCVSPSQAIGIEEKIKNSSKYCAVNYLFIYTKWAMILANILLNYKPSAFTSINIIWNFKAHHYAMKLNNWKRDHAQGGGVIRFYGIHLIALLSYLGYQNVEHSTLFINDSYNEYTSWISNFKNNNLPDFTITVNSSSDENLFLINTDNDFFIWKSSDPFNSQTTGIDKQEDVRCQFLSNLILENQNQTELWPEKYSSIINLWSKLESKTNYY